MNQALDRLANETGFAGEVPLPPDAWTGERVAALARHINGGEVAAQARRLTALQPRCAFASRQPMLRY